MAKPSAFFVYVSTGDAFTESGLGTLPEDGYIWYRSDTGEIKAQMSAKPITLFDKNGKTSINRKSGSLPRVSTSGSGLEAVSGIGFTPSLIHFFGTSDLSNLNASMGWSDSFVNVCMTPTIGNNTSILDIVSVGNGWTASVSTMDIDGFTLNWTKTGEGLNITAKYIAIK